MGMKQKLDKSFQAGFEEGQKVANAHAELRGIVKGSRETWELMENMFLQIEGIGPKTKDKILKHIQIYAQKEKERLER